MPTQFDPDDVRLTLTYPRTTGPQQLAMNVVEILAEHATTGDPLFRLRLSPAQFATLMSSHEVTARSSVPLPREAEQCETGDSNERGDCHGLIRPYLVTGRATVLEGHRPGETVMLCAAHAQLHGPRIRRPERIAAAVKP